MGFEPGAAIGPNLRLRRMLAKGGMGSVWAADHLGLKTQVAVKLIADVMSVEPAAQRRFALEAEAAAQIRSPHVVQVLDYGSTDEGVAYIVMELLDGETVGTRLARQGRMELAEVVAIITQTSKALTHAHSLGFVHRDIKPDNLFLTESNDELFVKVLDFGIAKSHRAISITRSGVALGTPAYMSPEQLSNAKHVTADADLWSLAAVAYRALVGRRPFGGDSVVAIAAAISRGGAVSPSYIRRDLPAELDIWFRRALDAHRVNRFRSAREFAETFARAARVPIEIAVPARLPACSAALANEQGRAAEAPRVRSVVPPSALGQCQYIHLTPSPHAVPSPFSQSSTHNDAAGRRSEVGKETRLYEPPSAPPRRRT